MLGLTPSSPPVPQVMLMNDVHFSSATDEWCTPHDFYQKWNEKFDFDIDVCASPENAKCHRFFDKTINGLKQEWTGSCWMNPPYGREISKWMKKAYESSLKGALVCCLVPARTDTRWWHDYAMKGTIHFVKGRLKFGEAKANAPFPSAVVIFGLMP